jgi:hypothetical protein
VIHKFMYISKLQVVLVSSKLDDENKKYYIIDLLMPLEVYWDVSKLLRDADYLVASGGQMADVHEVYKSVFRKVASYAVFEVDRQWCFQNSRRNQTTA